MPTCYIKFAVADHFNNSRNPPMLELSANLAAVLGTEQMCSWLFRVSFVCSFSYKLEKLRNKTMPIITCNLFDQLNFVLNQTKPNLKSDSLQNAYL